MITNASKRNPGYVLHWSKQMYIWKPKTYERYMRWFGRKK